MPSRPTRPWCASTMSTICRSDIHSWEGKRHNPTPGILGHEIIGTIEQLGRAVGPDMRGDTLREGDRVTWTEFFYCGACYYCRILDMPQKCVRLRKYGHDPADESPHLLGGFAEYCYLLPGTGIVRLPSDPADLADEEATPLNCGVATMVSVTEQAEVGIGDAVVVQGLGLLGLYGVALARARGARTRDRPRHHRVTAAHGAEVWRRSRARRWRDGHPLRSWRRCGRRVHPTVRTW